MYLYKYYTIDILKSSKNNCSIVCALFFKLIAAFFVMSSFLQVPTVHSCNQLIFAVHSSCIEYAMLTGSKIIILNCKV